MCSLRANDLPQISHWCFAADDEDALGDMSRGGEDAEPLAFSSSPSSTSELEETESRRLRFCGAATVSTIVDVAARKGVRVRVRSRVCEPVWYQGTASPITSAVLDHESR